MHLDNADDADDNALASVAAINTQDEKYETAIAAAGSLSWVDVSHRIVLLIKLFRFGLALQEQQDRDLLDVLDMLIWDDAIQAARSWCVNQFDLGPIMCSVLRPYFWDAVWVLNRDKKMVLQMAPAGSNCSTWRVASDWPKPAVNDPASCALVFFNYRLIGMEQLEKVNILAQARPSNVFDKVVRWVTDVWWANVDFAVQLGDWIMSELFSKSSQNTASQSSQDSQPSQNSQRVLRRPTTMVLEQEADKEGEEEEIEDRFARLGPIDNAPLVTDSNKAEPSQLPRSPRRPVIVSSLIKSLADDPDEIDSFGSDRRS